MIMAPTKHIMNRRMITRGRTARGVTELQELQNYTLPPLCDNTTAAAVNTAKDESCAQHQKQGCCTAQKAEKVLR